MNLLCPRTAAGGGNTKSGTFCNTKSSKTELDGLLMFGFIRIAGKARDKRMRINHNKEKTNKEKRRKEPKEGMEGGKVR